MLRATLVAVALVLFTAGAAGQPRDPTAADQLGRVFAAYQAGDFDRAHHELRGLSAGQLANPDYLLWVRGQIALQSGRPREAENDFRALAALTTSRFAATAPWRIADCLWEQGKRVDSAKHYARLVLQVGAAEHADLGVAHYRIARAASTPTTERTHLRSFLLAYPGHPLATDATRRLVELAGPRAAAWSSSDLISRARRLVAAHLWHEAVAELMLVPSNAPAATHVQRDYWLGTTLYKMRRRYADAGALLLAVAPKMDSAEALFHGARALSRADRDNEAIEHYRAVVAKYPRSDWASEAQYLTGWLEFNRGNYRLALAPLAATLRLYPASKWRDDALWFLGMSHFLLGQYELALPYFDNLGGRGAAYERGKGGYWWARTVDKIGRSGDAIRAYQNVVSRWPFTWYALLAQARLRAAGIPSVPFAGASSAAQAAPVDSTLDSAVEADMAIVRFDELERAGLDLDAGIDLTRGERAFVGRHRLRAALAVLFDRYGRGSNWSRPWRLALAYGGSALETPPIGDSRFWWLHAFPEAYKPLVEKYQALGGNPPYYLYAIMRKESGYDPHVLSYADAQGLLQMIPATTLQVAGRLGISYSAGDLYSPELNIQTASWYIGSLLQKFRSQIPIGAASFNSGPRPVMKWLDQNGDRPLDEMVELVSYTQTREYMKKVTENYARYVYLYTGKLYEVPLTVEPRYLKNDLTY